jgi:hypothetical protein
VAGDERLFGEIFITGKTGSGPVGWKSRAGEPIVVAAAIIEKDGRILIAKRKVGWRHAVNGSFGGRWSRMKLPKNVSVGNSLKLRIEAEVGELYLQ